LGPPRADIIREAKAGEDILRRWLGSLQSLLIELHLAIQGEVAAIRQARFDGAAR